MNTKLDSLAFENFRISALPAELDQLPSVVFDMTVNSRGVPRADIESCSPLYLFTLCKIPWRINYRYMGYLFTHCVRANYAHSARELLLAGACTYRGLQLGLSP